MWNYGILSVIMKAFSYFGNICRFRFPSSSFSPPWDGVLVLQGSCTTLCQLNRRKVSGLYYQAFHSVLVSFWILTRDWVSSLLGDHWDIILSFHLGWHVSTNQSQGLRFLASAQFQSLCFLLTDFIQSICVCSTSGTFQRGSQRRTQDSRISCREI